MKHFVQSGSQNREHAIVLHLRALRQLWSTLSTSKSCGDKTTKLILNFALCRAGSESVRTHENYTYSNQVVAQETIGKERNGA